MPLSFDGAGIITGLQVGGLPDGTVDQDTLAANSVNNAKLATGTPNAAALPSGTILQVKSATKTDTQAQGAGTTYTDISNMSVSITPASTDNQILVMAQVNGGVDRDASLYLQLVRGSTAIGVGASDGSRVVCTSATYFGAGMDNGVSTATMIFLDSPATTSSTTYKVQARLNAAGIFYINRREVDSDSAAYGRAISSLTVMEVAG